MSPIGPSSRPGSPSISPSWRSGPRRISPARSSGGTLRPLPEADEDDDLGLQALIRWVENLWAALVAFQWVVVAGGLAVPAMALINYVAYRGAYWKLALEA